MGETLGGCESFLAASTIAKLRGTGTSAPQCYWPTTSSATLLIGSQTVLQFGDAIELLPNTIYPLALGSCTAPDGTHVCASGTFTVAAPEAPLQPTAVLSAPATLSVCDDLSLQGANMPAYIA
jgi:hypothetical protein|eukprot:4205435-Prymnesium_polylepis.1